VTTGPALLCYEGSENARQAIAAAGRLLGGGPALVCHSWLGLSRLVLNTYGVGLGTRRAGLPAELSESADDIDAEDRERAQRVAEEGAELALAAGFEARPLPVLQQHRAWQAILEAADANHASIVVTGAHGQSGMQRALLGSVSTAVVHHAHVPVLVVPEAAGEPRPDGPLLLCYDGSTDSERAIEQAARLRSRQAVVVHLWESWAAHAPALEGVSVPTPSVAAELDEIAVERSARLAADGAEMAAAAGFAAESRSGSAVGPLWRGLLDVAADIDAAAVVVGSRGMSGISAVLGSVSNGVLHHADRPVLVVPPPAG
jgi:nucleotide-binding universal stress UspA family protein